jgi:integrase
MAATLTEKTIPNLEPRPAGPYEVRDKGGRQSVKGLLVRVQKSGAKTYYVEMARGKRERIGDASQVTLTFAREEAKRLTGMFAQGHDFQAERKQKRQLEQTTLAGYLEGDFKVHAEANISNSSYFISSIKNAFGHVLDKPMTEINELDLAKWNRQRNHVTLATRRRELANLKALLNHAVSTKVIPNHQLNNYRLKGALTDKQTESKIRYLTDDEEQILIGALDIREHKKREARQRYRKWQAERGQKPLPLIKKSEYADYLKPLILIAMLTGLRRGDLFSLTWGHVDLNLRMIRKVIGKTSHARRKAGKPAETAELPLSSRAYTVLKQLHKQRRDSPYVFVSPQTGGQLTDVKGAFNSIIEAANIKDFRFHDLRHTFASRLVMAGVDLNTVRELMTHSDIKMTLVYAHLSPDHKSAALDRAFGGSK